MVSNIHSLDGVHLVANSMSNALNINVSQIIWIFTEMGLLVCCTVDSESKKKSKLTNASCTVLLCDDLVKD